MKILTCLFALFTFTTTYAQEDKLIAAGVLPYTIFEDTVYLLLGYDADKPGWTDFGGGREFVSNVENETRLETPEEIAIREFFEECRMVYGREEIDLNFRENAYFTSANGVYRSYIVKIPYKPREEMREAMIPLGDAFVIFNEKKDFYWIKLSELKDLVRAGGTSLPDSPNQGVLYKDFLATLHLVFKDDALDKWFE